jgi:protein SCO1/2
MVAAAILEPAAAESQALTDATLSSIQFDQKINQQLSLDLRFRDEDGKNVRLGNYFGKRPVILNLGYYGCPMLCSLVLNGMVESLQDLKMDMGNQFEVISVSIDPTETPALAAAKKRTYLKRYGREGAESAWHFLTGNATAIKTLAHEAGFNYAYDAGIKQYAHPSGLIIATPDGKIARYFFGINYPPLELATVLKNAGAGHTGSKIEQLALLCFHYSPLHGKYANIVMLFVRITCLATLVGLAGTLARGSHRRKKVHV